MGIHEGKVRSMGKVVKIASRITVPIVLTVPIKYFQFNFQIFSFGVKFSFSSLAP